MAVREIHRDQWAHFFDVFSRQYCGTRVTVQVLDRRMGLHTLCDRQPLVGVTADLRHVPPEIEIIVGESPRAHLTHVVPRPARLWMEQSDNGGDSAFQIEEPDGAATLVTFLACHGPPENRSEREHQWNAP